jgi:hypothetical protein
MQVFECIKPTSRENFYQPYPEKLDEAISTSIQTKVKYKCITTTRQTEGKTYAFTGVEFLRLVGDNRDRCFTYDASKVKDMFVIVGGYLETRDVLKLELFVGDSLEIITTNKRPVVDVLIVIQPLPGAPIDYLSIGDVFTKLLKAFPNTRSITSDHFQNEKLRQEFISRGIRSETYFFGRPQQMKLYKMLRVNVWNNNLEIARDTHEVQVGSKAMNLGELWVHEGKRLIQDGEKIDHPNDGCFSGDTRVALVDGSNPTFEELAQRFHPDEPIYCYTLDPLNGIRIGVAKQPRITRSQVDVVELTLDNYAIVRCTPEHLFMTIEGEWVKAVNLTRATPLMPLYRYTTHKGGWSDYERVYCPIRRERLQTHQLVASQFLGLRGPGTIVHHKDGNKQNNWPTNLELMDRCVHAGHHTKLRHATDVQYVRALREGHRRYREFGGNEKSRANMLRLWDTGTFKRGPAQCTIEGCERNYYAKGFCEAHYKRIQKVRLRAARSVSQQNHRIINVRSLPYRMDVWDITVEPFSNFALTAGVFVHNSKDLQDSVAILVSDLMGLESQSRVLMAGVEGMTETALFEMVEKYMIERGKLRIAGIPEKEQLPAIAEALELSMGDARKLRDYVDERFPNY